MYGFVCVLCIHVSVFVYVCAHPSMHMCVYMRVCCVCVCVCFYAFLKFMSEYQLYITFS